MNKSTPDSIQNEHDKNGEKTAVAQLLNGELRPLGSYPIFVGVKSISDDD